MIIDALHKRPDILGAALNGLSVRLDVINNNIANVDTQNFKKSEVKFEDALSKAISVSERTGILDLSGVKPTIQTTHENFSHRLDGNNVEIELEMADLYQTQMRYEALVNGITSYYRRINATLALRM